MLDAAAYDKANVIVPGCCPKMPARKVPRSIYETARDVARDLAKTVVYVTSRRERKKIEMLCAHLKRIRRLDRLRLRGPFGARDEFLLAATVQNLRKLQESMPPNCGSGLKCNRAISTPDTLCSGVISITSPQRSASFLKLQGAAFGGLC